MALPSQVYAARLVRRDSWLKACFTVAWGNALVVIHKSKISEPMALLPPLPRIVRELRLPSQETIAANELGERAGVRGPERTLALQTRPPRSKRLEPRSRGFGLTCRSLPPHPSPLPHNVAESPFYKWTVIRGDIAGERGLPSSGLVYKRQGLRP